MNVDIALPQGYALNEYRIESTLGVGGFGLTYLATDSNLNLKVAIKEYLPAELAMRGSDQSVKSKSESTLETFNWGRSRFLDESRTLASFRHPNIVRVMRFFEANQTGHKKRLFKTFSEADLLIIDDLFLRKKMPEDAADYLLDIIIERYSTRKSTLLTSNRPLEDWGLLLKDNAASSAILDRLLHHGHLLKFEGKSYRLKEAATRLSQRKEKKENEE